MPERGAKRTQLDNICRGEGWAGVTPTQRRFYFGRPLPPHPLRSSNFIWIITDFFVYRWLFRMLFAGDNLSGAQFVRFGWLAGPLFIYVYVWVNILHHITKLHSYTLFRPTTVAKQLKYFKPFEIRTQVKAIFLTMALTGFLFKFILFTVKIKKCFTVTGIVTT